MISQFTLGFGIITLIMVATLAILRIMDYIHSKLVIRAVKAALDKIHTTTL